jgi:3-hydroxyisobutyrate dehydrogenase-like beta-hydroxyacid dehydrogenase
VLADGGVRYLSAPVQGSMFIIAKGFLSVLCSGDKDVYDDALPALEALGKRATYYGPGDESRCVKISNNMLVTAYFTLTGEILAVGEALGLPWQQLCERISACPASSKMLQDHADDLATRTWQSKAALTSTALRDLSLACDMAYEQRLALPVTACVRSYDQFMHAHSDYTSYSSYGTVAMLEQVCGIQPGEQPSEEQAEQYYQMLEGALACMQAELFAEGCVLSESYGVAWDVVLGDLLDCFGASTLMKAHAEQLKAREFAAGALPAAEAAGALHDFLAAAKARGVFTPIAEAAAQRINELLGTDENADIFELVKFAEKQAGVE